MKYALMIRYVGTAFHGYQLQPGCRTVQGELNGIMENTFGVPCRITGCSRTDAGVHANEFCITVDAPGATIPPERVAVAAIPYLPPDIGVKDARFCSDEFHPRYDAVAKEYVYRIHNSKIPDPFLYQRVWFLPRLLSEEGIGKMRLAASYLCGRHDFVSFQADDADTEDTVREVYETSLTKTGDVLEFRIRANGFLYNMVRIIVGTLTEVGFGKRAPEDIRTILAARDRRLAGMTAPADGLYLDRVFYDRF